MSCGRGIKACPRAATRTQQRDVVMQQATRRRQAEKQRASGVGEQELGCLSSAIEKEREIKQYTAAATARRWPGLLGTITSA